MAMATAVVGPPIQAFDASNNSSNLNLNILPITKVTDKCINTASTQKTNINAPFLTISDIDAGTPKTTKNK